MMDEISVKEKKEFLLWFLKRYKLKDRPSVWILNYLMSHENLLKNTYFVDDVNKYQRGMLISADNGDDELPSFMFFKGNLKTREGEKAFHDMRLHANEPLYIQLNFMGRYKSPEYLLVEGAYNSNEELSLEVSEEVDEIVVELEKMSIMKAIDAALDNGDEKLFVELCEMLNEVRQKKTLSFSG